MARRLGEMLLAEGLITEAQLKQALTAQKKHGGKLGSHLVAMNYLTEDQLLTGISRQLGIARIDLGSVSIDQSTLNLISSDMAYKYKVIPIGREGKKGLTVAMSDPTDMIAIDDIRFRTGFDIHTLVASETAIDQALMQYYPTSDALGKLPVTTGGNVEVIVQDPLSDTSAGGHAPDDPPAATLLNSVILDAILKGASAIHIEPFERKIRIRFRIDGVLHEEASPPIRMRTEIQSRLENLFKFDRAARRQPKISQISATINDHPVRMMAQIYPTLYGDKILIKIWNQNDLSLDISQLGLQRKAFSDLSKAISGHYGLIVFAGPHKTEKMRTYYSILNTANTEHQNVVSIEDPIEYYMEGVNQVEVNIKGALSLPTALQFLQDEDLDVIGISDLSDTAILGIATHLATRCRVYGLVGSHGTEDALTQLMNREIDIRLLAETLKCVVTQASVRKICEHCKTPTEIEEDRFVRFGIDPQKLAGRTYYVGKGCDRCYHTGYRWRQPVFEVMPVSPRIADMMIQGAPSHEIRMEAIKEGMRPIKEDALLKFARGITTLDEIAKAFS
ncbi:MAG: hypothetical protein D6675_16700 [Gemmatimonadetes bacterium]|nr:MAG: hypothetical protein D6675_16700 [Gemmatimonadota bacterium]